MKISLLLNSDEIVLVKLICRMFNAQWVQIENERFKAPK